MEKEIKCVVCGRTKKFPGHGRFIDGSWADDRFVPQEYHGKWVCCYHCYEKLLVRSTINKKKGDLKDGI